jgi:hypothetical protein
MGSDNIKKMQCDSVYTVCRTMMMIVDESEMNYQWKRTNLMKTETNGVKWLKKIDWIDEGLGEKVDKNGGSGTKEQKKQKKIQWNIQKSLIDMGMGLDQEAQGLNKSQWKEKECQKCFWALEKYLKAVSEKPMDPCNINKVNNDWAGLQCTTTREKCL